MLWLSTLLKFKMIKIYMLVRTTALNWFLKVLFHWCKCYFRLLNYTFKNLIIYSLILFIDPTRFVVAPTSMDVTAGESILLPCQVSHDHPLDIVFTWSFNGRLIDFEKDGDHFERVGGVNIIISNCCRLHECSVIKYWTVWWYVYRNRDHLYCLSAQLLTLSLFTLSSQIKAVYNFCNKIFDLSKFYVTMLASWTHDLSTYLKRERGGGNDIL